MTTTYTAQVGPANAKHFADGTYGPLEVTDLGGGTVQFNNLDLLRARGADDDAYVTDDEEGPQIWLAGESYPIFDEIDAAIADAQGLRTEYDEAGRAFDHAADKYAIAVANVVQLAGSTAAAAQRLFLDESVVVSLLSRAKG
jgi:hypothetical protein